MIKTKLPEIGKRYKHKKTKTLYSFELFGINYELGIGMVQLKSKEDGSNLIMENDNFWDEFEELPPEEPTQELASGISLEEFKRIDAENMKIAEKPVVKESLSAEGPKAEGIPFKELVRMSQESAKQFYEDIEKKLSQEPSKIEVAIEELRLEASFTEKIDKKNTKGLYESPEEFAAGMMECWKEHSFILTKKAKNLLNALDEQNKPKKPPLGVMSKYIWDEERQENLKGAILRYQQADLPYPSEWEEELRILNEQNKSKISEKIDAEVSEWEIKAREVGWLPQAEFKLKCLHGKEGFCALCFERNKEEEKPLWKPVSERIEKTGNILVKYHDEEIGLLKYSAAQRKVFAARLDSPIREWMTLTDFINDHEKLKERVKKLEKLPYYKSGAGRAGIMLT